MKERSIASKEKARVVGEEERTMIPEIPAVMDREEMTITLAMVAKMVALRLEAMVAMHTVVTPLEHLEITATVVIMVVMKLRPPLEEEVAKGMRRYMVVVQPQAKAPEEAAVELMEENPISPEQTVLLRRGLAMETTSRRRLVRVDNMVEEEGEDMGMALVWVGELVVLGWVLEEDLDQVGVDSAVAVAMASAMESAKVAKAKVSALALVWAEE